jgi:hypothetical protein
MRRARLSPSHRLVDRGGVERFRPDGSAWHAGFTLAPIGETTVVTAESTPADEADVTESAMFGFNGRELVVRVGPER